MSAKLILLACCLAPLGWPQAQHATPYSIGTPTLQDLWVDPATGNDANSGSTRAQALRTVTAAWNRIPIRRTLDTTGYRIRLAPGVYAANLVPVYWESRWGTFQYPILIEAADGPGTVTLPPLNFFDCRYLYLIGLRSTAGGGDVVHCEQCEHVLLRNVEIIGTGDPANYTSPQETLKINQSRYIYLENLDVSGAFDNAIDFVAVQYGHVIGSRIHRALDWCIYTKGGSANILVEGNEIYDCGTGGFTAGQGTGFEFMTAPWLQYEAYNIRFINNVIHDTAGAAFGVNGGYNILLAYNTATRAGTRSHGLEFVYGGRSCDGNATACTAHRNAGGWGPATPGDAYRIPNRNVYVYNNLFFNPSGIESRWQHFDIAGSTTPEPGSNVPSPLRADNNLLLRGNWIWNGPASLPLGVDGALATDILSANSINQSAPALDAAFKLTLAGPAPVAIPNFPGGDQPPGIPAGDTANAVLLDRDGRSRAANAVGAYAVSSSAPQRRLTLTSSPAAGGTIVASPASPNGLYDSGTVVQLMAQPAASYTFSGWSGALSGTTNPQSITLNSDLTVGASFIAAAPTYALSGRIAREGTGMPGILVTLAGASASAAAFTDANGNYRFPNLAPNAAYTVTPTPGAYSFTPPAATVANLQADTTANFTAVQGRGLRFVPLPPCRVLETRAEYNFAGRTGAFGPPALNASETRIVPVRDSNLCPVPAAAKAYVLNVTAIPRAAGLGFATLWPAGTPRPDVWTIRSPDGQIVANSAIVQAGASGAIAAYASDTTDLLLDISGYYTESDTVPNYTFYPVTPCRLVDTRAAYRAQPGPFGPPALTASQTRTFRFPDSPYCSVPAAVAYSVTLTVVPPAPLAFLTAWPGGAPQPAVSTINSFAGRVLANNVILPASANGAVDTSAFNATDLLIDVNGYYAPDDGRTGLSYVPVPQCRVNDSRAAGGAYGNESTRSISFTNVAGCVPVPSGAGAYALAITAIPNGNPLPFLTAHPSGQPRPAASFLNAFEGQTVTNAVVVPAGTGAAIDIYAYRATHVVVDLSGYFHR
ncbi:MAG: right-handed parallel beta-helix repeat-containing protein [Bryobacterales bacterium]|nr:right-handed parallel beta-helix repeat-containing protein [Bryobacterales bacterium]